MKLLSLLVALLTILPAGINEHLAYWDNLLDKYEALCNACMEKKSKKDIQLLSDNINELLKHPEGKMNPDQKARFISIQNKYRGFITFSDKNFTEEEQPRIIRVDTVRRYEHVQVTDTVFVKEILGSIELNQYINNKDTIYHIVQYQFSEAAAPRPDPVPADTARALAEAPKPRPAAPRPERARRTSAPTYLILGNTCIGATISYGGTVGVVQKWGGYAGFHSNFNSVVPAYSCTSDGKTADTRIMANGNISRSLLSITAGALYEVNKWLIAYAGAGYGEKTVFWQDIDGNWIDVSDISVKGVAAETGCILHLGVFGISFGISSTGFKSAGLKAGLGLVF